jgi:RNA polymerase sigma-70 factor, ECF subfamily
VTVGAPDRRPGRRAPAAAVEQAFRVERSTVLAALIRQLGDFQLAEDALQDAFAAAVATWSRDGVPANPGAWLMTTARRRAIDRLRRNRSLADRAARLAELTRINASAHAHEETQDSAIADERLRLIFTCCHPALALETRVALTLRMLGGLSTGEIARAFLVAESTMGQRLTRAKRKIAQAGIPYRVPDDDVLPARLRGVLMVVYLIFNEGYLSSGGERLVRGELCSEAVRLGRLLSKLMPDEAEVWGVLALMLLHDARRGTRVDASGGYVALDRQDRSLWDRGRIREGLAALERGLRLREPGQYLLQAAIAALHARAPSPEEVDWHAIAGLYLALSRVAPSPVVEINRAVALAFAHGAEAGMGVLAPLLEDPALERYQPLYAAQAELLIRAGDRAGATRAYEQAIAMSTNEVERSELERRRSGVQVLPG